MHKENFKNWLSESLTAKSGAISSYISAIDWLSDKFVANKKISVASLYDIEDIEIIKELYLEVKKIQKDTTSYIYNASAPSYGEKNFYSASLNKYIKFLESIGMSKEVINKTQTPFSLQQFQQATEQAGLIYTSTLISRFAASLMTKPFVLLSGLSGSGKTKLAQAFAEWICQDENQYSLVPVGADWTNREPLLGYENALNNTEYVLPENGALQLMIEATKAENAHKPYFLILDEMNLSHVERYFADFLSVMESKDKFKLHSDEEHNKTDVPYELAWPGNLFVIGTVNIDETTYMFSPKVLDRANVIEFRISKDEISSFLTNPKTVNTDVLKSKGASMASDFLSLAANKDFKDADYESLKATLVNFFEQLQKTGAEFGYRSASEIVRLVNQLKVVDKELAENNKIDIAIMQKLLPKLHGSRRKLSDILLTLAKFCVDDSLSGNIEKDVFNSENFDFKSEHVKYPISLEKITRMHKSVVENGFASYAEA